MGISCLRSCQRKFKTMDLFRMGAGNYPYWIHIWLRNSGEGDMTMEPKVICWSDNGKSPLVLRKIDLQNKEKYSFQEWVHAEWNRIEMHELELENTIHWALIFLLLIYQSWRCKVERDNDVTMTKGMQLKDRVWDVIFGLIGVHSFCNCIIMISVVTNLIAEALICLLATCMLQRVILHDVCCRRQLRDSANCC